MTKTAIAEATIVVRLWNDIDNTSAMIDLLGKAMKILSRLVEI